MATATATPRFVPASPIPGQVGIGGSGASGAVTPPSPRFVPASPLVSGAAGSAYFSMAPRTTPASAPTPEAPSGPSDVARGLAVAKPFMGLAASFAPGSGLSGANATLNIATGVEDILQGRRAAGSLGVAGGSGALLRALGIGGPAGAAIGGVTGLAGGALNIAQTGTPRGAPGLLSGGASLLNLAPASWTVGGVPLSMAGGAAMAQAAAEAPGLAAALGPETAMASASPFAGSSLAGAAGALGIPFAIGSAVENIVNAAFGQGAYAKTKLPFNRNANFSSADNLASQTSQFIGLRGANQVRATIDKATTPDQLWALAMAGPALAPNGEVQFYHPSYGTGGKSTDPTAPAYASALLKARAGDPAALRAFLSGVTIQSGESGATPDNFTLTDAFRRKLVSLLPADVRAQLGDLTTLFGPTPPPYQPVARAAALKDAYDVLTTQGVGGYTREALIRQLAKGDVGQENLSMVLRPPMTEAEATALAGDWAPPAPPPSMAGSGTASWYAAP